MKVIIYLFIWILAINTAISQTNSHTKDSVINYLDINKKRQGRWIKPYDNGKTAYEAYFINDIPIGEYKRYYYNGELKAKINYSKDKSGKGTVVLYWDTGIKMAEGHYINIKTKDGIWKMYGTDGALMVTITYANGKKNGEEIKYFRNNNPSELITWKNDIRNGAWKQFYDNGKTRLLSFYNNGERTGIFQIFYPTGRYYLKGNYKADLREGLWQYFDNTGKIWKELEYKNGVPKNQIEISKELENKLDKWEKEKGTIPEPTLENIMNGGK